MMCTGSEMFCFVVDDRAGKELREKEIDELFDLWSENQGVLIMGFLEDILFKIVEYSRLKFHCIRTILKFVFVKQIANCKQSNIPENCSIFDFFWKILFFNNFLLLLFYNSIFRIPWNLTKFCPTTPPEKPKSWSTKTSEKMFKSFCLLDFLAKPKETFLKPLVSGKKIQAKIIHRQEMKPVFFCWMDISFYASQLAVTVCCVLVHAEISSTRSV